MTMHHSLGILGTRVSIQPRALSGCQSPPSKDEQPTWKFSRGPRSNSFTKTSPLALACFARLQLIWKSIVPWAVHTWNGQYYLVTMRHH
jgi:hypothetical protein